MMHLFSCPQCGGRPEVHADRFGLLYAIVCDECGHAGTLCNTERAAATAWNEEPHVMTSKPSLAMRIYRKLVQIIGVGRPTIHNRG